MKYTVEGFSQEQAIKLGLDAKDLVLLRWMVDFYATGMMDIREVDNRKFFWISYDYVMRELPIMGINSGDALGRRLRAMAPVLDVMMVATPTGNRTYCGFKTEELIRLISKENPPDPKVGWMPTQKSGGSRPKSRVLYDSSINDSSIIDSNKQPGQKPATAPAVEKPVENSKTIHSELFLTKARLAEKRGFNIFQLTNRFYKQSRLREPLPESVLVDVLQEFLSNYGPGNNVKEPWPYFLTVLKAKSERHFSERSSAEGDQFKKEPAAIGKILAGMTGG